MCAGSRRRTRPPASRALVDGPERLARRRRWSTPSPRASSLARPSVPVRSRRRRGHADRRRAARRSTTLDRMQTQLTASLATAGVSDVADDRRVDPAGCRPGLDALHARDRPAARARRRPASASWPGTSSTPSRGCPTRWSSWTPRRSRSRPIGISRRCGSSTAASRRVPAVGDITVVDARPGSRRPVDRSVRRHLERAARPARPPCGCSPQRASSSTSPTRGRAQARSPPWRSRATARGSRRCCVTGGRPEVWIAGIVRDADTVPVRLGRRGSARPAGRRRIGTRLARRHHARRAERRRRRVAVQRAARRRSRRRPPIAPQDAASVAGATSISTVRLRTDDGALYVKRGANWQRTTSGVLVLAHAAGLAPVAAVPPPPQESWCADSPSAADRVGARASPSRSWTGA